jgi:hypothetical protein
MDFVDTFQVLEDGLPREVGCLRLLRASANRSAKRFLLWSITAREKTN